MKIIRDDSRIHFQSWEEILKTINDKKIKCFEFSTKSLLEAINKIRSVSHKTFFKSPQLLYISSEINQIKYYPSTVGNCHYGFIHELINLGFLIDEFGRIYNNKKFLTAPGIFTNFGSFSQFIVTVWLSRYLKIIDLEVKNKPLNTDILAIFNKTKLHFHVKDIRERDREARMSDAISYIDHELGNRAREMGAKKRLAVKFFSTVPPLGVKPSYWEQLGRSIDEKPQIKIVSFSPGGETKNTGELKIKIGFEWRDFNGTFISPMNSFNSSKRLEREVNTFGEKIKKIKINNDEKHILVCITEDKYDWDDLREQQSKDNFGLMIIEEFDFEIERAPLIFPSSFGKLDKELNNALPASTELFNFDKKHTA